MGSNSNFSCKLKGKIIINEENNFDRKKPNNKKNISKNEVNVKIKNNLFVNNIVRLMGIEIKPILELLMISEADIKIKKIKLMKKFLKFFGFSINVAIDKGKIISNHAAK